jgi:hypothetical protein
LEEICFLVSIYYLCVSVGIDTYEANFLVGSFNYL